MEQKTYNKAESQKLMIDGELFTAINGGHDTYFKFDGTMFNLHRADGSIYVPQCVMLEGPFIKYVPKPTFKVGDHVKCERWGRGKILEVKDFNADDDYYMVKVYFSRPDNVYHFSLEGYYGPYVGDSYLISIDTDYLGTTVDGVDIYEGCEDALYYVVKHSWEIKTTRGVNRKYDFGERDATTGFFSTKQAAQEWVDANKPKEIVGTTLDGVEIEKGKVYTLWSVDKEGEVFDACTAWDQEDFTGLKHYCLASGYQRFFTKAAAEDWKEKNLVGITEDGWHVWNGAEIELWYVNYIEGVVLNTSLGPWRKDNGNAFKGTTTYSDLYKSKEAAEAHLDEYLASKVIYPKDSCVVITRNSYNPTKEFPVDFVYKLREGMTDRIFRVYLDMLGTGNGYANESVAKNLDVKLATSDQTKAYEIAGKPIHIDEVEDLLKPKVRFENGNEVIHPGFGEGIVRSIQVKNLIVKFNSISYGIEFERGGKYLSKDVSPTLFFKPGTKQFKIGQKVKCLIYGEGVVIKSDNNNVSIAHPVNVKFNGGTSQVYKADGRWRLDATPTLFHIVE